MTIKRKPQHKQKPEKPVKKLTPEQLLRRYDMEIRRSPLEEEFLAANARQLDVPPNAPDGEIKHVISAGQSVVTNDEIADSYYAYLDTVEPDEYDSNLDSSNLNDDLLDDSSGNYEPDINKFITAPTEEEKEESKNKKQLSPEEERALASAQALEHIRKTLPNPPTQQRVDQWHQKFGKENVFLIPFSGTEIYIFRPLYRNEYKQILDQIRVVMQKSQNLDAEAYLQQKVVSRCVLWPQLAPEWADVCKAGTIKAIFDGVMAASNFMAPEQAISIIQQI